MWGQPPLLFMVCMAAAHFLIRKSVISPTTTPPASTAGWHCLLPSTLYICESTPPPLKPLTNWSLITRHCSLATPCHAMPCHATTSLTHPLTRSSHSDNSGPSLSPFSVVPGYLNWMTLLPLLLTDPSVMATIM